MKRLLMYVLCLICTNYAYSADSTAVNETQNRILKELIEIKSIQDSTYQQRIRAFEARGKSDKSKTEYSPAEYSILYGIKNNTDSNFFFDSWNSYGILALVLSIFAVYYACKQYRSQKRTEENTKESERHTKNAPISAQIGTLEDLPRHFYRNLVCTGAIIFNYLHPSNGKDANRKSYPSESNLLKLLTLSDDIFLPIDIDENSYKKMHELKLLFRNYNTEVKIASEHLSRPHLTDKSLEQDFDNLLFKPLFITGRMFEYENMLCSVDIETLNRNAALRILNEHFKKLMIPGNMAVLMKPLNNTHLKQLLDSKFSIIDKKGAITRSLKGFSSEQLDIKKEDFVTGLNETLANFIKEIPAEKAEFIKWFNKHYNNKIVYVQSMLTAEDLYESLKPYLDYVNGKDWNFEKLFRYMLAVDIAIETDRIGMINY